MTYVEPYCITRHRKLIQWDVALKHEWGHLPINNCGWKCWGDVSCCQTGSSNLQWSICWTAAGWLCVLLLWCFVPESWHSSWTLLFPHSSLLMSLFVFVSITTVCPSFPLFCLSVISFLHPILALQLSSPLPFMFAASTSLSIPFFFPFFFISWSLLSFLPPFTSSTALQAWKSPKLNRGKYSYWRIKLNSSITFCEDFGYFGYLFPFAKICLCTFWK